MVHYRLGCSSKCGNTEVKHTHEIRDPIRHIDDAHLKELLTGRLPGEIFSTEIADPLPQ